MRFNGKWFFVSRSKKTTKKTKNKTKNSLNCSNDLVKVRRKKARMEYIAIIDEWQEQSSQNCHQLLQMEDREADAVCSNLYLCVCGALKYKENVFHLKLPFRNYHMHFMCMCGVGNGMTSTSSTSTPSSTDCLVLFSFLVHVLVFCLCEYMWET